MIGTPGSPAVTPITVACIGLGAMGLPMAAQLIAAGHTVRGYDPMPDPLAHLLSLGGAAAPSPAAAAEGAHVVLLMVHNAEQARHALWGDQGAAPALAPGAVVWLASTVTADDARGLAAALHPLGIALLDGPVSGGVTSARTGTLTVIAGGDDGALQAAQPALQACASQVFHVGPVGAGASVKLINNLLAASHVALTAEALALGVKAGVSLPRLIEVVQHSSGQSRMFDKRAPRMTADEHEPQVAVRTFLKDLDIACAAAAAAGCHLPVMQAAQQTFSRAAHSGLAQQSDTMLFPFYREGAGLGVPVTANALQEGKE
jgi:putative dehydrogenase